MALSAAHFAIVHGEQALEQKQIEIVICFFLKRKRRECR